MSWFSRLQQRYRDKRHRAGFDYAAGVLLFDGIAGIHYLEQHVCMISDFSDYDDFDRGVEAAIAAYKKLLEAK